MQGRNKRSPTLPRRKYEPRSLISWTNINRNGTPPTNTLPSPDSLSTPSIRSPYETLRTLPPPLLALCRNCRSGHSTVSARILSSRSFSYHTDQVGSPLAVNLVDHSTRRIRADHLSSALTPLPDRVDCGINAGTRASPAKPAHAALDTQDTAVDPPCNLHHHPTRLAWPTASVFRLQDS